MNPNPTPLPPEQLAALRRLAEAATKGAWKDHALLLEPADLNQLARDNDQAAVGLAADMPYGPRRVVAMCGPLSDKQSRATAAYIAAASPDVITALLADNATLTRKRQTYRDGHDGTLAALEAAEAQNTRLATQVAEARAELGQQEADKLELVIELEAYKLVHQAMQTKWHAILRQVMAPLPDFDEAVRAGKAMQRAGYTPEISILNCQEGCEVCADAARANSSGATAWAPMSAGKLASFGYEEPATAANEVAPAPGVSVGEEGGSGE